MQVASFVKKVQCSVTVLQSFNRIHSIIQPIEDLIVESENITIKLTLNLSPFIIAIALVVNEGICPVVTAFKSSTVIPAKSLFIKKFNTQLLSYYELPQPTQMQQNLKCGKEETSSLVCV